MATISPGKTTPTNTTNPGVRVGVEVKVDREREREKESDSVYLVGYQVHVRSQLSHIQLV